MRKILFLSLVLTLATTMVVAQQTHNKRVRSFRIERGLNNSQLTVPERSRIRGDEFRYKTAQHRARRDGVITREERRRLKMMRRHNHVRVFRLKHNRRHRVI